MRSEIITIGDELLIGQVINTNQAFIAEQLNTVGIFTERMTTVGDDAEQIVRAFSSAWSGVDVVCVTGGLGPTHDDITRKVVCDFFTTDLVMNDEVLAHVKELARRRNIPLLQTNIDQALVPRKATVIPNMNGTAPGMMFEQEGKYFFVLPGVPFEMKSMMLDTVIPFFEKRSDGMIVRHRTLKTTGIGESLLADKIGDVRDVIGSDRLTTLAFLPNPMGTKLRITVKAHDANVVRSKLDAAEAMIRSKVEKYIYSDDDKDLEHVIGMLLQQKNLTLAVAESCTGGLISHRITNVPGSSRYFMRGFITYSDQSKIDELNIDPALLRAHGAVSKESAMAMAKGARVNAKTDIALSCTGIAGPTGGTEEKPVGLCYIGYSDAVSTHALKFNFGDHRLRFKDRASQSALELLRRKLLNISDGNE
jgi:nicotinamide-nucleotide amidase